MKHTQENGFTLLEMMVVVAVFWGALMMRLIVSLKPESRMLPSTPPKIRMMSR